MQLVSDYVPRPWYRKLLIFIAMVAFGVAVNLLGARIAARLALPLYMDTIGTMLVASLGGYLPGIVSGLLSPVAGALEDPTMLSYGMLNVMLAVMCAFYTDHGWFKKFRTAVLAVLSFAFVGGCLGSLLTWFLYGFAQEDTSAGLVGFFYRTGVFNPFAAELLADYLIDVLDKGITVALLLLVFYFLPAPFRGQFHLHLWRQQPLTAEAKQAAGRVKNRSVSLRIRLMIMLVIAGFMIGLIALAISFALFMESTEKQRTAFGLGIGRTAAGLVNGDDVDRFLQGGEREEGYQETRELLQILKDSAPEIKYLYIYQIRADGCHVVFDMDGEDFVGAAPGDVEAFDESFREYLPDLLTGKEIDPIVSDDQYGWLLTAYLPIYDSTGDCKAYAGVDIEMEDLRSVSYNFLARTLSLFVGVFILIMAVGIFVVDYTMVLPLNTMALALSQFSGKKKTRDSVQELTEQFASLDIRTGDEIENLYRAFMGMTGDNLEFISDIQKKNAQITKMQDGLIMVLADMVESRDKNTGDHVRKTAAYTRIIMDEMKKEGVYVDQLTDRFVADVYHSAPLHDVGKINVPDAILNKPGRLTEEEFEKMKTHTTVGGEIIERVMETVSGTGTGYLKEAKNLALYHHEKWNGQGYPTGLAGEEIPLSARIMAVADVFDALISTRSYKKGFPFEKAMGIIRESAGTHFDPLVAQCFLNAEDRVREVAEEFGKYDEEYIGNR